MAYIYQITNDINGKIYIGKTENNIQKRFNEHCKDAFRERCEKRPLYAAMRKYGIEHFHIELIEETDNPEEREIYWISEKNSYHNGYNATLGGDGKKYIDENQVIQMYQTELNAIKTAEKLGICQDSVLNILKRNNIEIVSSQEINRKTNGKTVVMLSLDDKPIQEFVNMADAARYLIDNHFTNCKYTTIRYHISEVCNGKRKTTAGFKWQFKD